MDVVLGLLLLSILAAERPQVNGEHGFGNKYGETPTPVYWPVLEELRFPVDPNFPIGGPVGPGYLPIRPQVPQQHHSFLPQGPPVAQSPPQQQGGFPAQGPPVAQSPPQQHGGFPAQGPPVAQSPPQQQGGFPAQGPPVFHYHSYRTKPSQHYGLDKETKVATPGTHFPSYPPQGPNVPQQHPSYPPQGPSVLQQHPSYPPQGPSVPQQHHPSYPPQGPSVPQQQHPSYPPQGPSVPKQQHPSYPPQGPKNPQQKTYSTTSPGYKYYFGKPQMIDLPQKPYIAMKRPGPFPRRHH